MIETHTQHIHKTSFFRCLPSTLLITQVPNAFHTCISHDWYIFPSLCLPFFREISLSFSPSMVSAILIPFLTYFLSLSTDQSETAYTWEKWNISRLHPIADYMISLFAWRCIPVSQLLSLACIKHTASSFLPVCVYVWCTKQTVGKSQRDRTAHTRASRCLTINYRYWFDTRWTSCDSRSPDEVKVCRSEHWVRDTRPAPHVPRSRSCLIPKKIDSLPSCAAFERRRRWEARRGWNFMKGCNKKSWSKRWGDEKRKLQGNITCFRRRSEQLMLWMQRLLFTSSSAFSGFMFSGYYLVSELRKDPVSIFSVGRRERKKVLRFEFSDLQKLIDEIQWCSIDRQLRCFLIHMHTVHPQTGNSGRRVASAGSWWS